MEDSFGLYLVMTNPAAGYENCARAAVAAGVRMLQLRMKKAPREEIVAVAKAVREMPACLKSGVMVFANRNLSLRKKELTEPPGFGIMMRAYTGHKETKRRNKA